jgi:hypothetical protein
MDLKFRFNSLAALTLTVLYNEFFSFTKHDPAVSAIMPFGDDPYDSVASVALIVSILLTVLALIRAFRPYGQGGAPALSKLFLGRAQMAIALGPLVALVGDAIAMARHTSAWMGKAATGELLELMAGMAAASLALVISIRFSMRGMGPRPSAQVPWRLATMIGIVCAVALATFPEAAIANVFLHFVAIVAGFVIFLAPLSALVVALLPDSTEGTVERGGKQGARVWIQWASVAAVGVAIGTSVLLLELLVDGNQEIPARKIVLLSAMFIGAGTAALLTAFAFLRKPLGLFRKVTEA